MSCYSNFASALEAGKWSRPRSGLCISSPVCEMKAIDLPFLAKYKYHISRTSPTSDWWTIDFIPLTTIFPIKSKPPHCYWMNDVIDALVNATCPLCFEFCNCNFFFFWIDECHWICKRWITLLFFEFWISFQRKIFNLIEYWIRNWRAVEMVHTIEKQFWWYIRFYDIFKLSSITTYIRSTQTLRIHSNFSYEWFIARSQIGLVYFSCFVWTFLNDNLSNKGSGSQTFLSESQFRILCFYCL